MMELLEAFATTMGWRLGFLSALKHFVAACGNIQSQVMMGLLPLSLLLSVH